jgi:hypothetical protein
MARVLRAGRADLANRGIVEDCPEEVIVDGLRHADFQ